jgi:predicted RNA methylase
MYYTGTLAECTAYDEQVIAAEKYPIKGDNWANPIEVPSLNCYAIIKHDNYISEMDTLDTLPEVQTEI